MNKKEMHYIKNNNQGIIALIKRNETFEFNALDSSHCVLEDNVAAIENGEYFNWITESKLDYELMQKDFLELRKLNNKELLEKYLIWERPNIFIDFDDNFLVNYYPDRLFERMVPKDWKSIYVKNFEEFVKFIPQELRYWE